MPRQIEYSSSYAFDRHNTTRPEQLDQDQPVWSRYYRVETNPVSNITLIDLRNSDGDPSRWLGKDKTVRIIEENGQVNYYADADRKTEKHWRKVIGAFLARQILKTNGWRVESENCLLKELPHGYKLYIHKKGDKDIPRTDAYLYGAHHPFRSPEEFCLHALWLAKGSPTRSFSGKSYCQCVYCDGRYNQRTLNKQWDIVPQALKRNPRRNTNQPTTDWSNIRAKDYTQLNMSTEPPRVTITSMPVSSSVGRSTSLRTSTSTSDEGFHPSESNGHRLF